MKKSLLKLIGLSILVVIIGIMTVGCNEDNTDKPGPTDEMTPFINALNNTSTVSKITQTLEVKTDSMGSELLVYSQKKTFNKSVSGYAVAIEEKRLNSLGENEPYTESSDVDSLEAAETFVSAIKLNDSYFDSLTVEDNELNATIKDASVSTVFGLNDVNVTFSNAKLVLVVNNNILRSANVTFEANGFKVSIVISFTNA